MNATLPIQPVMTATGTITSHMIVNAAWKCLRPLDFCSPSSPSPMLGVAQALDLLHALGSLRLGPVAVLPGPPLRDVRVLRVHVPALLLGPERHQLYPFFSFSFAW